MYIYKKKTTKNKIKQHLQIITMLFLAFIGSCSLTNIAINKLKTINLYSTKMLIINEAQAKEELAPNIHSYLTYNEALTTKPITIEQKILRAFPHNYKIMLAIAKAESGLDPLAININTNGSQDTGLFQINSIHNFNIKKLKDVDYNIEKALFIYNTQGITAWATYNNGDYLKHLDK